MHLDGSPISYKKAKIVSPSLYDCPRHFLAPPGLVRASGQTIYRTAHPPAFSIEEALGYFPDPRLRADRRIGHAISMAGRWPWELADRGPIERRSAASGSHAPRRHDPG